jgi:protein-tyrosine-phosphatase
MFRAAVSYAESCEGAGSPASLVSASIKQEMKIAFVCTANVCRSVMAQAILERMARAELLDVEVTSAGIHDFTGTPPADNAWLTCLQNNTPVSKMESVFVGDLELETIDCFLAMERCHRDFLVSHAKVPEDRIRLLGSFDTLDANEEIVDPINRPRGAFQECFDRIERCIKTFLAEQKQL